MRAADTKKLELRMMRCDENGKDVLPPMLVMFTFSNMRDPTSCPWECQ